MMLYKTYENLKSQELLARCVGDRNSLNAAKATLDGVADCILLLLALRLLVGGSGRG